MKSLLLSFIAFLTLTAAAEDDIQPSFPNHALVFPLDALPRAAAPRAADEDLPFTWDQYAVVYENSSLEKVFRGFDPEFQPLLVDVQPAAPTHLTVTGFDGNFGIQAVKTLPKSGGTTETFQFRVVARNIESDIANYIYDIRSINTRVRLQPALTRSRGDFIKPGQIVRFSWSQTANLERFPKCEALLTGRTGTAKGLSSSSLTSVLAVKVQPFVLGHYLMLVTPREVRGEPPRGSTSNGQVFRCVFGSDNLPPVPDGFSASAFTPAAGQSITLQPNLTDPETGQTIFSNQSYTFDDNTPDAAIGGPATHTYDFPGIYRVRCKAFDNLGADATAEDSIIVGATPVPTLAFNVVKQIPPEEAGEGLNQEDSLTATFKGIKASAGDRIIFLYNRNQFGRYTKSLSDSDPETDIVLSKARTFSKKVQHTLNGVTNSALVNVAASGNSVSIKIANAQLDRTGDPRLGRCELKGIFKNQRIALCVIPPDPTQAQVLLYTGNVQARVKGGQSARFFFIPEERVVGTATIKEPNPKLQEP